LKVKLTIQIKLLPDQKQAQALLENLEIANKAANRLSQLGWEAKEFKQFPLHKRFYRQIRDEFPLTAQIVIRLIAKVADAYKLDQKKIRIFRKHGSICYDSRILTFNLTTSTVNIWTTQGRLKKLPFVCSENTRKLLELPRGEADLILRDNKWFLNITVEIPEEKEYEATSWLGVDMGIAEIAVTSDGVKFSGKHLNNLRSRHNKLRGRLQSIGTRSSRRLLRKRRHKEQRFSTHTNHVISKQIVTCAKRTGRGIALEQLKGISSRIRASRVQRRSLHSWAFAQLGTFIGYKARRAGVPVIRTDPRNSSRECPSCHHISKKNRPKRDLFLCEKCGHTGHADHIAATNHSSRASIIRPYELHGVKSLTGMRGNAQDSLVIAG